MPKRSRLPKHPLDSFQNEAWKRIRKEQSNVDKEHDKVFG
jgi:hypothetical protein